MTNYLQIKKLFEEHSNQEKAVQMAKYMRNQFVFYGLQTPERKALYKDFLRAEKRNGTINWNFLNQCYQDEHREFQYLVTDYLITMANDLTYDDVPKIFNYIKMKQWWDTIDKFDRIVGNIGLSDDRIDTLMLQWSKDTDFWVRRIAIDHQLTRKEKTNTELLEQIIINNFGNDEFFINKAIGWSLRDYSKTDPTWVRDFLAKYQERMHTLSIKEASKYL